MTIHEVRIRNFRGFTTATLELRPLTVLIGPNSSGKSAFGHALAALAHAHTVHKGTVSGSLSPRDQKDAESWPIDFGNYRDLVTKGTKDRVYVDLRTDEGWVENGFGGLKDSERLLLSYIRHPLGPSESSPNAGRHVIHDPVPSGVTDEHGELIPVKVEDGRLTIYRTLSQYWQKPESSDEVRAGLNGVLLDTVRWATGTQIPLGSVAQVDMMRFLENTTYLRGSRKRPARGYERGAGSPNIFGYAGEWTASLLDDQKQPLISYLLPPQIPTTVDEAKQLLDAPWISKSGTLKEAVGDWLTHMELARAVQTAESPRDKQLIEILIALHPEWGNRDLTEVGYGISQLLPVLAAGLRQSTNGIFVVDLPEAHLHPRPQAQLADFFCSLALSGRTVLVETHSEMLFHQLRLHAALNTELQNKIAVYFCDPPDVNGLCHEPRRVGLDFDSQPDWPERFLKEAWEVESQISAVVEARRQLKR